MSTGYRHARAALILAGVLALAACAGSAEVPHFRTGAGAMKPCPDSPNCVSSSARDPDRRVPPLRYRGDPRRARAAITGIIRAMPRSRITVATADFVHAEFRSAVFGFVDDLTLRFDDAAHLIQVRSAARSGYYDFGVNRRRVETLRDRFRSAMRAQ